MNKKCPDCKTYLINDEWGSPIAYCPNEKCPLFLNRFPNHYILVKVVG